MKTLTTMFALSLALAGPAFAKNGDDDSGTSSSGGVKTPARGTRAWFVLEAGEHSLRNLSLVDTSAASNVRGIRTTTDGDIAAVVIDAGGAIVEYSCIQFDDFSKSGTVVKKEVACQRL